MRLDYLQPRHEHVAEPLRTLKDLRRRLAPDGVLYVEVPIEIWTKPPLQDEPVTHVNFFSSASLRHLMEHSGLGSIDASPSAYRHPSDRQLLAARVLGGPNAEEAVLQAPGCDETKRVLQPRLAERVYRNALTPGNLWGAVRYRIKRYFQGNGNERVAGFHHDR